MKQGAVNRNLEKRITAYHRDHENNKKLAHPEGYHRPGSRRRK
jgi:hypothetical protein